MGDRVVLARIQALRVLDPGLWVEAGFAIEPVVRPAAEGATLPAGSMP